MFLRMEIQQQGPRPLVVILDIVYRAHPVLSVLLEHITQVEPPQVVQPAPLEHILPQVLTHAQILAQGLIW